MPTERKITNYFNLRGINAKFLIKIIKKKN